MLQSSKLRTAIAALLLLVPALGLAQDSSQGDPNDVPLGDVARNLRKKPAPAQQVIDDDNLSKVMDQAETRRATGSGFKFLMAGETKYFQVATPDATCSLSFSANAKSLLSSQYAQMDLPPGEMLKLKGPAAIEGDALTVSLINGTDWHVSEIGVALTVVRRNSPDSSSGSSVPLAPGFQSEVRPEKKPDQTVIYRMRAAASPAVTTVFSAPLNLDLAPGDEWHWAIVQAKGYPPDHYSVAGGPALSAPVNSPQPLSIPVSLREPPPDSVEQQPK